MRNVKTSGIFFSNFCGLFRKLELYCKEMGRRLCDRMTWIFNDSSSSRLSLGGLKATFRYNARGKSYSSKGCPFVLGCIERLVSPNRECVWRPTFAGSPLPARKFPSKRCHLPPPEKQPCSLVHSLVALLTKPFSLPHRVAKINFPPFLQERCVMAVRYIYNDQPGLFGIHNVDCKTGGFLPQLIFLIVDAYIFNEAF